MQGAQENHLRSLQIVNEEVVYRSATQQLPTILLLFPFDGSRWLRRHIVTYAVHIGNLLQDSFGNLVENSPVDMLNRSGHCIDGIHRTDDNRPVV